MVFAGKPASSVLIIGDVMKYYLIPAYELDNLEKERVALHKTLGELLPDNLRVQLPVCSLTSTVWRIANRKWKSLKLWKLYKS